MMNGVWGKKIGMTQVFSDTKVIPVTVIDTSFWVVTQVKTQEKDGYNAIQVGYIRSKYQNKEFEQHWLKSLKKYFEHIKEVKLSTGEHELQVGQSFKLETILKEDEKVDVTGITKGAGFAGVVKRHNFSGGRASHGARFGRFPGGLSFMTACGKVIKGKKMPGHMGVKQRTTKALPVVSVKSEDNIVLVKGSVAGKPGSFVFVRKADG